MKLIQTLLIVGILGTVLTEANAGNHKRKAKVDSRWEKKADKNNDGKVEKCELKKAWKHYQEHRSEVDKEWEKKADLDGDGKISHEEFAKARMHLRYHHKSGIETTTEK